jgi:DNA-binding XRE family transcriptional regulator
MQRERAGPPERPIRSRWQHQSLENWRRVPAELVCEVRFSNLDRGRWLRQPASFVRCTLLSATTICCSGLLRACRTPALGSRHMPRQRSDNAGTMRDGLVIHSRERSPIGALTGLAMGNTPKQEVAPFGAVLLRLRAAAGLTQEQLAARAGFSTAAISALESGKRRSPRFTTVELIAPALTLDPQQRRELEHDPSASRDGERRMHKAR